MNLQISKPVFFILVTVLILLVILIIFVAFNLFTRPKVNQTENTLPTPLPTLVVPENDRSNITIIGTTPEENTTGEIILNPSQRINFMTSESLSPEDVRVEVSPSIPLSIENDPDGSLAIFPTPPDFWAPNVPYTITLLDNTGKVITKYQMRVPQYVPQEVLD